jgi:glycerophosphoryl diester phosphodiesterase
VPPIVIAHRTCPHDAPENSLLGIRKAAELGADGVEIDLRMSLDQRPFLMHDNTMQRTARFLLPLELTPSFLVRKLRLQGTSEHVPSLDEVLDALPEGMLLAVDVKSPWSVFALMGVIKRRRIESRVLVWCSSGLAVRYAIKTAPDVEIAYYKDFADATSNHAFIAKAHRIGANAVSLYWPAIDADLVASAHALGLRVYSWHAGFALAAPGLSAGLDGLITDFPRQAREALAGLTLPGRDRILD